MPNPRPNPYIGPRSFRTGEKMYGRERETLELLDLIIAERIVLLYSPSGAGKTSLIQAALVPKLREDGFFVLRPLRVSANVRTTPAEAPTRAPRNSGAVGDGTAPPPGSRPEAANFSGGVNRFILSTLLSLEEPLPQEKRMPTQTLLHLTLDAYLKQRTDLSETSPVFIFDQFEEILTLDPMNLDAKFAFFEQVGEVLRDRSRWALFSMREDYLAGLDPYVKPIPTRFATTYRLDLLGVNAAHEAIQKPAQNGGVDFTNQAADKLTDDLRRVQIQRPDGTMETQPGPYVEPVQLQVVCFRLWDKLPETKNVVVESDIADVGDVSTALADYYDTTVKRVVATSGASERAVREWFDRQLITEQGIRGQVLMEPEASRGLSNNAIRLLEDAHLVRADERRGATWFELAHDRLIEPVRASNTAWFRANLSALQQQADLWERQGRPDGVLLGGAALVEAETWAQHHSNELTQTEQAFLSESREARLVGERESRQNRRIRWLALGASILSLLALVAFVIAVTQFGAANASAENARNAQATAVANEQEAQRQRQEVITQDRVSKMVSTSLSQLEVDPEVSLLLATQAYSTTHDVQTDDALRQAIIASRLRQTLTGHTLRVLNATLNADGTRLATAGADGTARMWDLSNGALLATIPGHAGTVWSAAYSPDGSTLLTTDDAFPYLWDANCLQAAADKVTCLFHQLPGHTASVYYGAFSPDGSRVVTASGDQTAIVWNVANGAQEHVLRGHLSEVYTANFSPDGKKVVTASADQTLRVWDLDNCSPDCAFQEFTGPAGAVWSASYSPDGQFIVAASDDQNAYVFDAASGSILALLVGHTDAVYGAAYSPDENQIVTASADGTARLWDAYYGTPLAVLRGHSGNVNSVAFNPDGELIVTASDDGTAKVWNEGSGAELKTLRGHTNKVFSIAFSPDGNRVVTASEDRTARVWDAADGTQVFPVLAPADEGDTGWVTDANFSPDGTRVVSTTDDGTVRFWDLAQCQESECTPLAKSLHDEALRHAVYSPDGTRVLTAGTDGKLRQWDANTLAEIPFQNTGDAELVAAVYSPDGTRILTAGTDGMARVVDAENGETLVELKGHSGGLTDAAFSPDGTWIITGSQDRTARIWDTATGAEKFTLRGHSGSVSGVAISPDGRLILTASADKTARLWDAATGDAVSILRGHTDGLTSVTFSPDGKFIATSSSDRTARITLTQIQDIFDLAQTRVTRELSCDEWKGYLQESDYCPTTGVAASVFAAPTSVAVAQTGIPDATAPPGATLSVSASSTASQEPTSVLTETTEATAALTDVPSPTEGAQVTPTIDATGTEAAQVTPTEAATEVPQVTPTVEDTVTEVPPGSPTVEAASTEVPAVTPSETAVTEEAPVTPTEAAPPTDAPTSIPQPPPGVYVTSMRSAPLDPNARPLQISFGVNFLNTTGADVTYSPWNVAIYRLGENKSFGDVRGTNRTVPVGESEEFTDSWKAPNVGNCESYTAVAYWENESNTRIPFQQPDGEPMALPFQVCP